MCFDCQYEGSTLSQDYSSEIPELVRAFFGLKHAWTENHHKTIHNGFDFRAATELLRRDPSQVHFVTYKYKKPRQTSSLGHGKKDSNTFELKSGGNLFLHSPLRWACIETAQEQEAMEFLQAIRDIDPTQFLLQDSHGQLPIDGECILNASLELTAFLLDIYLDYDFVCPNGVGMTEANFNPITCMCGSYWSEDIRKATQEILSGKRIVCGENVLEDNLGIENNFWEKIILLTKAFYHKTIDEDQTEENSNENSSTSMLRITNDYADRRIKFRLLHACAGIDWFPPNLLRLLAVAFPQALLEQDEDGNLPIHVAAGGFFESYFTIDISSWECGDLEANSGYQKTTIDILLEANPDLAKFPNEEGRLPLELAIESGTEFCSPSDLKNHKRWRPWEDGGIGSLLDAYPEAARIRSPVTGKLPLEITLGWGSSRDWEDGVQALVAAYPEAARTKNPLTGKYPIQLALERETHFDKGIYGLLEVFPEAAWVCSVVPISPRVEDKSRNSSSPVQKGRKRSGCANHITKRQARLPLFAHAALEKCSASVVYKLLRTNPESCRRCLEEKSTATIHREKRRRNCYNI